MRYRIPQLSVSSALLPDDIKQISSFNKFKSDIQVICSDCFADCDQICNQIQDSDSVHEKYY